MGKEIKMPQASLTKDSTAICSICGKRMITYRAKDGAWHWSHFHYESLVRRRRTAFLFFAAGVTIPIAFAVRGSGEWTTFGAAVFILVALMVVGTATLMGPWQRSDHDWEPGIPPEDDPDS